MATLDLSANQLTAAPYGQACEACAKSRCKCLLRSGQHECQRCHRLGKECRAMSSKRKRLDSQSTRTSSVDRDYDKTAQLERRLTELEASFRQQSGHAVSTNDALPPTPAETHDERQDLWNAAQLTRIEAGARLATFRTIHLKWAPFIHLDPATTSTALYQHRPVLWLSIMVTCAKDDTESRHLDKLFRQTIAEEMVLQSRKSIDLLLGLLVFISWYHHHCRDENGNVRSSLSLLMHMATSLVSDLKQSSSANPRRILDRQLQRHSDDRPGSSPRSMEDRRAFLWCFLASNIISTYLKHDSLRWSTFLEACLEELTAKPECSGDEVLIQLVKMQLVLDRSNAMRGMGGSLHVPTTHYVQLLYQQLRQVQESCPPHLKYNGKVSLQKFHFGANNKDILMLQYYALELSINELALTPRSRQHTSTLSALQQHATRHACLSSTKLWLDRYLECPPHEYTAFAFPSAIQSSCCLAMLFDLSSPEDPIWSKTDVQETNALNYVDKIITQMDEAIQLLELGQGHGLRAHVQLYRSMKMTWEHKMSEFNAEGSDLQFHTDATDLQTFGEMFDFGMFENEWLYT